MCGKFTQLISWENLVRISDLIGKPDDAGASDERVETVTPMRFANVVTLNEQGERVSVRMRWGLFPPWAEDHTFGTKHIHARAETIDEKKTFRDAFENRRGILITKTFNEGEEISKSKTQQYILTPKDGMPVGIAVIWERWTAKDGATLLTFAMVTTPPNEIISTITDRMPAELPETDWPKWLGEEPASLAELKALLCTSARDLDMQRAGKPPPPPKPPKPPKPARDDGQSSLF